MWTFAPVTWPIAKLLDRILGEDHGTTYKKAGLKTLVTLHQTIGSTPGDRLNEDEVTIISGVLDLKTKSVGSIMTPMNDVFTLPADAVLDEEMMDNIMREGYSRIPIHEPKQRGDFVGMLLVKMLITYDPEDAKRVDDFALATLPETRPETSCLDIINFFQQGKSHMVLVSDFPGKCYGALGVVTLEDVIEELIGEEIIDESDVFIDIHKAIRRIPNPGQYRGRVPKGEIVEEPQHDGEHGNGDLAVTKHSSDPSQKRPKRSSTASMDSKAHTFMVRRNSNPGSPDTKAVQMRPNTADWRQQLNRLGPSNAASRPKATRVGTVMIKPAVSTIRESETAGQGTSRTNSMSVPTTNKDDSANAVASSLDKGESASDAVQALHTSYGTLDRPRTSPEGDYRQPSTLESEHESSARPQATSGGEQSGQSGRPDKIVFPSPDLETTDDPSFKTALHHSGSTSTLGSLHNGHSPGGHPRKRTTARSGSITENLVESGGGVRKLVLKTTESNEDEGEAGAGNSSGSQGHGHSSSHNGTRHRDSRSSNGAPGRHRAEESQEREARSKRRQRRRKKPKAGEESKPLLDRED